jgi:ABC-type ATPase with predicted acetyltransferase domain
MNEAYQSGDYQVIAETIESFALNEEKLAVWRCFASDERSAINKFCKSDECVRGVDANKIEYTQGEEQERFLKRFE